MPDPIRSKRCTATELAKVGVTIVGSLGRERLECLNCAEVWDPETTGSGRFANGYWKCPHGCNTGGGPKGFRIRVAGRWFPR